MAVASPENLQTALDRAIAWRKKEIVRLRELGAKADDNSDPLFRAGVVLLCAHWEGFLKTAIDSYIDHVFAQALRLPEVLPCFVAISYFSEVTAAAATKYPGSEQTHIRLAQRIAKGTNEVCTLRTWRSTTEGNPSSDTLERLLQSAGLDGQLNMDEASWSTTKVFIDEQIVGDRNRIAHGEGLPINRTEFMLRSQRVTALMDVLAQVVLSSARAGLYRTAK